MIFNRGRGYSFALHSTNGAKMRTRCNKIALIIRTYLRHTQSYYGLKEVTSHMKSYSIRFIVFSLMTLVLGSLLLVACQRPGTSTASTPGGSSSSSSSSSTSSCPTVHMNNSNFVQSTVTVSKGCTLTLTDDVSVTHIIMNGSWVNGTAEPKQEPGAPTVSMTFSGNDTQSTPAWNTPGTYHLYCSVHPNMNLTVTVK